MKVLWWVASCAAFLAACGGPKFRTCRTNADCLEYQQCDVATMLCVIDAADGGGGSVGGGDGSTGGGGGSADGGDGSTDGGGSTGGGGGSTGGGGGSLNHWDVMTWDVGNWE